MGAVDARLPVPKLVTSNLHLSHACASPKNRSVFFMGFFMFSCTTSTVVGYNDYVLPFEGSRNNGDDAVCMLYAVCVNERHCCGAAVAAVAGVAVAIRGGGGEG